MFKAIDQLKDSLRKKYPKPQAEKRQKNKSGVELVEVEDCEHEAEHVAT